MEPVPVVNYGIRQTAENMIEEHGPEALAEAKKQVQFAELSGAVSLAKNWNLVCAAVADLQGLSQDQMGDLVTTDVTQEGPKFAPPTDHYSRHPTWDSWRRQCHIAVSWLFANVSLTNLRILRQASKGRGFLSPRRPH